MEEIYRVSGALNAGFVGQITYTVCLERACKKLDIAFSFDKRTYGAEDLTPERVEETRRLCRELYGLELSEADARRRMLNDMKTEIHTLATLNDAFIGCVHKQLIDRHMVWDGESASEGCIPQPEIAGVLKVTVLAFNVLMDDTRYALSVRAE